MKNKKQKENQDTQNESIKKSKWSIINKVLDVICYLVIIVILFFWQYLVQIFPSIQIEYVLISILVLFASCWIHVINDTSTLKKQFQKIDLTDVMKYDYINNLFSYIKDTVIPKKKIKHLRILDMNGNIFLPLLQGENSFYVEKCQLLIKRCNLENSDTEKIISTWKQLETYKKISELEIIYYDADINDFMCIIDEKLIIQGFFDGNSIYDNPNIELVDITSRKGYTYIQQYLNKYNILLNRFIKQDPLAIISANKGTVNVFTNIKDNEQQMLLQKELEQTTSILAIGVAITEISQKSPDYLKNFFVDRSGKMRLMYCNPNGEQIKIREENANANKKPLTEYQFPHVVKFNMGQLKNNFALLKESNPAIEGNLQIRIYDFPPTINCIITDNAVFFHSYGFGSYGRGITVPSFVIKKDLNPEVYQFYFSQLNYFWTLSQEVEEKQGD